MKKTIIDYEFKELLFDTSLYKDIDVGLAYRCESVEEERYNGSDVYEVNVDKYIYSKELEYLIKFMDSNEKIHGFCPICRKELVLELKSVKLENDIKNSQICEYINELYDDQETDYLSPIENRLNERLNNIIKEYSYFNKKVVCSYNNEHKFRFIYNLRFNKEKNKFIISKVGQNPSRVELNKYTFKKYRKSLGEIYYSELIKAEKLYLEKQSIGAFIYLRRIFEKLVKDAKDLHENNHDKLWHSDKEFYKEKMEVRIKKLKDYLPKLLVEQNQMFSVLSAGIHSLEEQQCEKYYPTVKEGIILMLDEAIEKKEILKREKNFVASINKVNREIKKQ